jgi:hypothetical protein
MYCPKVLWTPKSQSNHSRDCAAEYANTVRVLLGGQSTMKGTMRRTKSTFISAPLAGAIAILRLYGPLEPWFKKTWQPGEIELAK